jgi:hypothetical protein
MLSHTLFPRIRPHLRRAQGNGPLPAKRNQLMNISFGIYAKPSSTKWSDIRKGPPLDAVREHIDRVVNFGRFCEIARGIKVR